MDEINSEKEVKRLLQILTKGKRFVVRKKLEYGIKQTNRPGR